MGNRPYTDTNTAKDSWFMALLTFGEGYHNFHHYFQADYRNGVRWFHFDPTKWTISLLEKFHLASKLKKTPNFSSSTLTCLHRDAEKKQKWPLLNLVRQILKVKYYRMKPYRKSAGKDASGKKKYVRYFLIEKLKQSE